MNESSIRDAVMVAQQTIALEIEALESLQSTVNSQDFEAALKLIFQCKGRVVVTGIGKSAIVAQKIVATMNSTGTPALFMHAADAIHGDLGIITDQDIIICLSKSGGTPEIRTLVGFLVKLPNPIIAITAEQDSYLSHHAHHVLLTPFKKEADPNNLAPTTSSTAQMALGDALAMALLNVRKFQVEDFAKFHPGGALGKKLYLTAADLYKKHDKPVIYESNSIKEAIIEISSKRLGVTVVLNAQQQLIGIVTDGDLRRMLVKYDSWDSLPLTTIMTPNPKSIPSDTMAIDALHIMRQYAITQLPVVDNGLYVGIVHLHDIIAEGIM
jgi:arabinose-5-phosphate isomerase